MQAATQILPEISFGKESATPEFIEEIKPLLQKHWQEIAHFKDIPLDPAWDDYLTLDKLGMLRVYTARLNASLIGYCIFIVRRNPLYKTSLQASQDILFIDPAHRNQGFGRSFIDWCDSMLKLEGVQVSYQHVKEAHNFGPLLESLGYELVDLIYLRRLDHG